MLIAPCQVIKKGAGCETQRLVFSPIRFVQPTANNASHLFEGSFKIVIKVKGWLRLQYHQISHRFWNWQEHSVFR
jgi:hypothetical protein